MFKISTLSRYFQSFLFFISALGWAPSSDASERKFAVIMDMGSDGPQGAFLRHDAELAQKNYLAQGYEVIFLSNEAPSEDNWATKQNLQDRVFQLKGVSNLKIDLYGHGTLKDMAEIPSDMKDRYPEVKHPEPLAKGGEQDTDFKNPNTFMAVSITPKLANIDGGNHDPAAVRATLEAGLGVGDIRNIVTTANTNNPGLKTGLSVLNCFGGSLGQELSTLPGVSIYTAAESTKTAIDLTDRSAPRTGNPDVDMQKNSVNYNLLMNRAIESARTKGLPITQNQAHEKAVSTLREGLLVRETTSAARLGFNFPLSATQNYVLGWCNRWKDDGKGISENPPKGDLTAHIQSDLKDTKIFLNWIKNIHIQECMGPIRKKNMEEDLESRRKITLELQQKALQKIRAQLKSIGLVNPDKLKATLKARKLSGLKQDLEMAQAVVFGVDSEAWQFEQIYIDTIKKEILDTESQPFDLQNFKTHISMTLDSLEKSGCFTPGSTQCFDPHHTNHDFTVLLGMTADLFEPTPFDPIAGSPRRICAKTDESPPPPGTPTTPPIKPPSPPTTEEKLAANKVVLACIEEKIDQNPIRLALEVAGGHGPSAFSEPEEVCKRLKNEKSLYRYRLSCGKNFIDHASIEEITRFQELAIEGSTPL